MTEQSPIGRKRHASATHRYLAEFDFRYNGRSVDDDARAGLAHTGAEGKRLTYRRTHSV